MAEAFLNQLPRVRRGVFGKFDQRYFIYIKDYDIIFSVSDIIKYIV